MKKRPYRRVVLISVFLIGVLDCIIILAKLRKKLIVEFSNPLRIKGELTTHSLDSLFNSLLFNI